MSAKKAPRAGDAVKIGGSTVLLWMRTDLPREDGMEYWRGPHSQLVARTPGFLEYRQHHFPSEPVGMWPPIDGVETDIPAHRRIDGTPEVVLDGAIGSLKSLRPNKRVHADEANVFGRTILHVTSKAGGRWFTTATEGRTSARTVVLFRRRPGVDASALEGLLNDDLGPELARLAGVTEVRTQPFAAFKAWMWNTPGVAHDYPDEDQFHGCLIIGAGDQETLEQILDGAELARHAATVARVCAAVHAYPVTATYTYTRDGRPLLPQIKPEPKAPLDPVKREVPPAPPVPAPTRSFPSATLIPLPGDASNPQPGAEDVVVGADGHLYGGLGGGAIVRVAPGSDSVTVVADTGGRPLGLEALPDGRLLVCDAHRGLLRVDPTNGDVETLTQYVSEIPLRFCSNATTAPDGAIWFTESSTRFDFEQYLGSFFEHRASGRLLRRDPDGTVEVVLDDLYFANGLTLTPDKTALILAETSGYRLSRIDLAGPSSGQRQTLSENLPGFPDNISTFTNDRAWVAMTAPRSAGLDKLATAPGFVRKLVWRMPASAEEAIVWVRAITADGTVVEELQGQRDDFRTVTGCAELDGRLYLASPHQSALLRLDLP